MKNALTGRAALLGVAACMLATPSGNRHNRPGSIPRPPRRPRRAERRGRPRLDREPARRTRPGRPRCGHPGRGSVRDPHRPGGVRV